MAFAKNINVMWFRQDLRLADNPALTNALEDGKTLPIFILDNVNSKEHVNGAASKWWLHHSLIKLNKATSQLLCPEMKLTSSIQINGKFANPSSNSGCNFLKSFNET